MRSDPEYDARAESPELPRSVRALFGRAVELPQDERAAYLDLHAPNASLRREVEDLLAADLDAEVILDRLTQQAAHDLFRDPPGLQLGPYRTVRLLGRGGMGAVYLAERTDGEVEQRVAVKVIHGGLELTELVSRFQAERRILARLSHPNIAAFYDAGTAADGRLWLAMEYVDGAPIDQFADSRQLGVQARVGLFLKVLEAVEYAHRNVVIHRDLKPANILVDGDANPKLLDFGIARVLGGESGTGATRILTPEFAAPEQIRGEAVTTATDTYLAGGVLYKLLTGTNPHDLTSATPAQVEELICERDVVAPRQLNPALDKDLENIVLMSLRREPNRRYSSVAQFADDLERYLEGRPVGATPDSWDYRARRFVSRHRIPVSAAIFCFLALIGGTIATAYQAAVARRHFQEVRTLANSFLFDFEKEIHELPGATKARGMVIQTGQKYLDTLYAESPGDSALMRELAVAYDKLAVLQGSDFQSNTGEYNRANENFRRAIGLRLQLGDGNSSDPKVRRTLVRLYATLGLSLLNSGRSAEAKEATFEGARHGEEILKVSQAEDATMAAFNGYRTHATILAELGEIGASYDYFGHAKRVAESWESAHPEDRAGKIRIVDVYYNLADAEDLFGDVDASALSARRALDLVEPLIAKKDSPGLRRIEVLAEGAYARALAEQGPARWKEADEHFQRAIGLARDRARKDAANKLAGRDTAFVGALWGESLAKRGDRRALSHLEETKRAIEGELQAPRDANVLQTAAAVRIALSESLLHSNPRWALEEAAASVKLSNSILSVSPNDSVSAKDKLDALLHEADAERALGQKAEALKLVAEARRVCDRLLAVEPGDKRALGFKRRVAQTQLELSAR